MDNIKTGKEPQATGIDESPQNFDSFDINQVRAAFPILHQEVNGKQLVYFDNAATTQKPRVVIDALHDYYSNYNANIHRGIHTLAEKATTAFEETRKTVKSFLNANEDEEIIFTKGTTEGINLVAATYGRANIQAGDEIIISSMEHHSNIVPWQILCEEKGAHLKIIPVFDNGELDIEAYKRLLNEKTKIVSVLHASNTLGTINPIKKVIDLARQQGAVTVVDGAQAAAHLETDVQKLGCDFYVMSAHKVFGPTGTGILYGKRRLLEKMPPYQGGGEMIDEVTFEKTTYGEIPYKFEAGTPNIGDVVAFKKALEFVNAIGKNNIMQYEKTLTDHATDVMGQIKGLRLIGNATEKVSVISFVLENIHHFDIGMMLDSRGIAIRTGHHCTQPLMGIFGIDGTARASFSVYNTTEEIDLMVEGIEKIIKMKS